MVLASRSAEKNEIPQGACFISVALLACQTEMKPRAPRRIGLAIAGAGRIGLIRGEIAARHGNVVWIGVA
jgi:hypothetical protein